MIYFSVYVIRKYNEWYTSCLDVKNKNKIGFLLCLLYSI